MSADNKSASATSWQVGTWTLTAPDGRTWQADSPLKACSLEQRERITPEVALKRIFDTLDEPPGIPDGMVLVPAEPNRAMLEACLTEAKFQYGHGITMDSAVHLYRAMIAAAKATGQQGGAA